MNRIITALLLFCFSSFAIADRIDEVKNLKAVLAELEENSPELMTSTQGRRIRFLFKLIEEAHAAGPTCFYAGWPSTKMTENGKSYCTSPKAGSSHYPKEDPCGEDQLQCQPVLFGKGLCVSTAARADRINAFKNCEKAFTEKGSNYSFLSKLTPEEDEQLKEIGALAQQLCKGQKSPGMMCRKILDRIEGNSQANRPETNPKPSPVKESMKKVEVVTNVEIVDEEEQKEKDEQQKIVPPPPAPGELTEECIDKIQDDINKIIDLSNDVAKIIGNRNNVKWNRRDTPTAEEVVDIQEEVLCLEMEIFVLQNQIDFKVDCKSKPKKLPPMHMELVKHDGKESVYDIAWGRIEEKKRMARDYLQRYGTQLDEGVYDKYPEQKQLWVEKVANKRKELECLENFRERRVCPDSTDENKLKGIGDYLNASTGTPKVTMFIDHGGKLIPFKTFDKLQIRAGLGPKIEQGDEMTPEGTFRVVPKDGGVTNTSYFSAAHIRYEDWGQERQRMLSSLSNSEKNPRNKGGDILIHGSGGSIGCLSFSNSESAYFAALARNKGQANEPLRISIYPGKMNDGFIQSSQDVPELKKYKDFWEKLKITYDKERGRTSDAYKTINQIYDEY